MSLLRRINNGQYFAKGILEQILEDLHAEGALQHHIDNIIEVRKDTLTDEQQNDLRYNPVDFLIRDLKRRNNPELSQNRRRYLMNRFLSELDPKDPEYQPEEIKSLLDSLLPTIVKHEGLRISKEDLFSIGEYIFAEMFGLGPLEALLVDSRMTDIVVTNFDRVYATCNGVREHMWNASFDDANHLQRIIDRIFAATNPPPYLSSFMTARWQNQATITCMFPGDDYLHPVLIIHKDPPSG